MVPKTPSERRPVIPQSRLRARKTKRTRGWIGYNVTVCGTRLQTDADLICLLPPNHPNTIHASIAIREDNSQPVMCVQHQPLNNEEGYIEWVDVSL